MGERRTFWLGKEENQQASREEAPVQPAVGVSVLDLMRPPKKKRNRQWEKAHPGQFYRGIPTEVREQVRQIAETLGVTADEVARAFLEYGLECVKRGTLVLSGLPNQRRVRMTLYASGQGWAENGWTPTPPAKEGRRKKSAPAWKQGAYYRIPNELHEQVKRLAGETYPVGEVAAVLLKNGIENYERGVLVLLPQPKIAASLGWSGGKK